MDKEAYYDTDFCDICHCDTEQKFITYNHERDSSRDMVECLRCHSMKFVFSDEWIDQNKNNTKDDIMEHYCEVSELKGKTLIDIVKNYESLKFICNDGSEYLMYHDQDCCESVTIDDIDGELHSLIGTPLLIAEEITNRDGPKESCTWTFYKFATIKGYVDIRWRGESNGFYSERVNFKKVK